MQLRKICRNRDVFILQLGITFYRVHSTMGLLILHHPPIPSQIVIKQTLKVMAKATSLWVYTQFDPFASSIQPLVSLWAIMGPQNASVLLTIMLGLLPARTWWILYEKEPDDMDMSKAFSIPRLKGASSSILFCLIASKIVLEWNILVWYL